MLFSKYPITLVTLHLFIMLVDFLTNSRPSRGSVTLVLGLTVVFHLNGLSSIGETASFPEHSTSNSAGLEEMVDVFEPHVRSFWEEEVDGRDDDDQIQCGEENVGTPVDVLDRNLQKHKGQH